ncbi:MAG: hypothetical protein WA961_15675 [Rhodanobacter sp.]
MNTTNALPGAGVGAAALAGDLTIMDDWQPVNPATNRIAKPHFMKCMLFPLFDVLTAPIGSLFFNSAQCPPVSRKLS